MDTLHKTPGTQYLKKAERPSLGTAFKKAGIYHEWPTRKDANPNKNKLSASSSKKISPKNWLNERFQL